MTERKRKRARARGNRAPVASGALDPNSTLPEESVMAAAAEDDDLIIDVPGDAREPAAAAVEADTGAPAEPAAESSSEILFREARARDREGDVAGAIALYQKLLREEPDNIRARNQLGCLFDLQGQHALALEQYEFARALAPDNVEVLLNIGDTLVALTRYDQAEKEYKRAQKLDPSRPDVHVHLGILYFKRGLYAAADVELKKATDLDSENETAWFYRGEALNQLMRVDEALESLLRTVQLQPANSRAYYLLGIIYDKKRLPDQAMAMYRKSRELAKA